MKKLVFLSLLLFACNSAPTHELCVLSCSGQHQQVKEGDILTKNVTIDLEVNDEILLHDRISDQVYQLSGPLKGNVSKLIENGNATSFTKDYFSFIIQNISKPEKEYRSVVMGGTSRSLPPIWNYLPDENLIGNLNLNAATLAKLDADKLEIYLEDQLISDPEKHNMEALRDSVITKNLKVALTNEGIDHLLHLKLLSHEAIQKLNSEEQKLIETSKSPMARLNFYLENKLFRKAELLLKSSNYEGDFAKRTLNLIENG